MKLLFWIALFVLVYWALRDKNRKQQSAHRASAQRQAAAAGAMESMLQCCHCGVHFPASEAVRGASGDVFCSEEHLRLYSPASSTR